MPTSFDLFGTLVAAERPDDHAADGGVDAVGGRAILLGETPLGEIQEKLEAVA